MTRCFGTVQYNLTGTWFYRSIERQNKKRNQLPATGLAANLDVGNARLLSIANSPSVPQTCSFSSAQRVQQDRVESSTRPPDTAAMHSVQPRCASAFLMPSHNVRTAFLVSLCLEVWSSLVLAFFFLDHFLPLIFLLFIRTAQHSTARRTADAKLGHRG